MKLKIQEGKEEDHLPILNKVSEVGIDEVGRGAIFGPVFSAAVVLSKKNGLALKDLGVKDSKQLTPKKRRLLFPKIISLSSDYGIGQSSAREIDKFGIRHATELSMIRAVQKLENKPSKLIIDGPLPLRLWKGSQKNILLGIYHLKNKRGLKKFEMFGEPGIDEHYTFDQIVQNTHIYFNFHNEFISAPKNLKNKMMTLLSDNKNNKKGAIRFGVVPVFLVGSQFTHAHSNIILFDFKEQTCERFEPYGFSTDDTRFDTRMRHFLKNSLLPFKMKYLKPLNDEEIDLENLVICPGP